jgi:hypothetical protein
MQKGGRGGVYITDKKIKEKKWKKTGNIPRMEVKESLFS